MRILLMLEMSNVLSREPLARVVTRESSARRLVWPEAAGS